MNEALIEYFSRITDEEAELLQGRKNIRSEKYFDADSETIDHAKLLEHGRLIEIRPHTRFVHFPRHSHNYIELVYMLRGSTTHIINGVDTITLSEGDLLFMGEGAIQEILPAGCDDIAINFIILPQFFDRALSMMDEENVLRDFIISCLSGDALFSYMHFQAADILPVQNLIENMLWSLIYKRSETATNTINQVTMGLVFQNISAYAEGVNKSRPERYEEAIVYDTVKYIDEHYKHGSLADIAETLGHPAYYVSRLLKRYTGENFKELLQKRRMQQAAYLLSHTTISISDIYAYIGYDNSSYFYRTFRARYGCSPREYRQG